MKTKRFFPIVFFLALTVIFSSYQIQQDHKVLFEKAKYTMETKADLKEAINLFESLIKTYPNEKEYVAKSLLYQGMCYEKLGNQEAVKKYQRVIDNFSSQKNEVALAKDRLDYLSAAKKSLKMQAEQHLKKGNELFGLWEYESAIEEYKKAMEPNPNSLLALNAQYYIGQTLFRQGKHESALEIFKKLVEENPESNIAPVTELMISQVEHEMKENKKIEPLISENGNEIIDTKTGITFKKVKTFTGESDIITYNTDLNISPNGKFLLFGNMVVPVDGSAPFELIDFKSTGIHVTRGTWSPDGNKAAFFSGDALCVVPVSSETGHATGPYKKINTTELKYQINPSWSPDSKNLIYQGPEADLWMTDADGNELKQITKTEIREIGPAWSPDGKNIAFGIGNRNLGLYNLEENTTKQLADYGQRCFPVWSPDGNWLLMNMHGKLQFHNLKVKRQTRWQPPMKTGEFFSWSADKGKMLFFKSSYHYNSGLKIASSNGGPSFEPVPNLTNWGTAAWTSDNRLIAVQSQDENGKTVFRIVPLNGGKSFNIELDNLTEKQPFPFTISSKLDKLLFNTKRDDGKEDLYVVPISANDARTTGPALRIFEGWYREGAFNIKFSLSPEGDKVALVHDGDIWITYTNGDEAVQVKNIQEEIGYIRWTPNGKSLLFNSPSGWRLINNPENQGIVLKLLAEGKEFDCRWPNIRFSPDNKRFAVMSDDKIEVFKLEKIQLIKTISTIALDLSPSEWWDIKWSPDGEKIAFIGVNKKDDPVNFPEGKYGIYIVPINGDKPIRVAPDDDAWKAGISWSPNGKWIAFTPEKPVKVNPESTIWEADFKEVKEKLLELE